MDVDYEALAKKGLYTITASGRKFYPWLPDASMISHRDIAHALSLQCRFNGHVTSFYSVAQHVVSAHDMAISLGHDQMIAAYALLHDFHETWLGDIVRPYKDGLGEGVRAAEDLADAALYPAFGLDFPVPAEVKQRVHEIDNLLLYSEAKSLMANPDQVEEWTIPNEAKSGLNMRNVFGDKWSPWSPEEAEGMLLGVMTDLNLDGVILLP